MSSGTGDSAQSLQNKGGYDAHEYAGGYAAEHENRKIEEYAQVLYQGGSNEQLSQIVKDSCGHTDTGH